MMLFQIKICSGNISNAKLDLIQCFMQQKEQKKNDKKKFLEYQHTKAQWEDIQTEKGIGAIVRSKVKWAEYGEKNSKYFFES